MMDQLRTKFQASFSPAVAVAATFSALFLLGGLIFARTLWVARDEAITQTTTAQSARTDLEQWRALGPRVRQQVTRDEAALAPLCTLAQHPNKVLVDLVTRSLDDPRHGVRASTSTISLTQATPTPAPPTALAMPRLLGGTPAPAAMAPTPAPSPTPAYHDSVAYETTVTLDGVYAAILDDLIRQQNEPFPIEIENLTFIHAQLGEGVPSPGDLVAGNPNQISLTLPLLVHLPSDQVCTIVASSRGPLQ